MPELPDVDAYIEALRLRLEGRTLETIELKSPFFLRTAEPPLSAAFGRRVAGFRRLGKRIAIGLDEDFWLVMHLMIAGRFLWQAADAPAAGGRTRPGRNVLATLVFDAGTLTVTEAGTKKRASLYLVAGSEALAAHDPGGLESSMRTLLHSLRRSGARIAR